MRISSLHYVCLGMFFLTSCVLTSEPAQIQELDVVSVVPEQQAQEEAHVVEEIVPLDGQTEINEVPHYTTLVYQKPLLEHEVRETETTTILLDTAGVEHEVEGICGDGVFSLAGNEYYRYETEYFTVTLPYNKNWGLPTIGYQLAEFVENEFGKFWLVGRPYVAECSWMREMSISQRPLMSMEEKMTELQDAYGNYTMEQVTIQGYPALRVTAATLDTVDYYIFAEEYIYGISAMPFSAAPTDELLKSFVLRD